MSKYLVVTNTLIGVLLTILPVGWLATGTWNVLGCLHLMSNLFAVVYISRQIGLILKPSGTAAQQGLLQLWLCYTLCSSLVAWLGFLNALSLTSLTLTLVILQILSLFLLQPHQARHIHSWRRPNIYILCSILLISIVWIQQSYELVRYTPIDSDNMWYHFPMIAEMIRNHSIWYMDAIPIIARAYPGYREATMTFLSLPLGHEHLAIPAVLEWILAAWTVAMLLIELCIHPTLAWTAAAYFVSTPMVAIAGNGNDMCLAIQLLFTVLALVQYLKRPSNSKAIIAGLALGALAATKYSGLIYTGLLLFLFLLQHLVTHRIRIVLKDTLRRSLLVFVAFSLIAGPWYLRNIIQHANPLYPATLQLGPIKLQGVYDSVFLANKTLKWNIMPLLNSATHFVQAYGWLLPILLAVVMGGLILSMVKLRHFQSIFALLLMPYMLLIAFLHQPYNMPSFHFDYNMRYLIGWYGIVILVALVTLRRVNKLLLLQYGPVLLLTATLHNIYLWSLWYKLYLVSVGFFLVTVLLSRRYFNSSLILSARHPPLKVIAALGLLVILSFVHELRERNQYTHDYGFRDAPSSKGWGEIARSVHGQIWNKTIVVHGDDRFFPFYGNHFQNAVWLCLQNNPHTILEICIVRDADYLICLNRIQNRSGLDQYEHAGSIAQEIMKRFPGQFEVVLESQGAYLLRRNRN